MVWWVVVVLGGWKPILVYSSGPTFELELESELALTWPDHVLTMTLPWPWPWPWVGPRVGPWSWQFMRSCLNTIFFIFWTPRILSCFPSVWIGDPAVCIPGVRCEYNCWLLAVTGDWSSGGQVRGRGMSGGCTVTTLRQNIYHHQSNTVLGSLNLWFSAYEYNMIWVCVLQYSI